MIQNHFLPAALGVVAVLASAARGQEDPVAPELPPTGGTRLPFVLETGQSFEFQVQWQQGVALPPAREDVPREIADRPKAPAETGGTGTSSYRFILRVKEKPVGGSATLELQVRGTGGLPGATTYVCVTHPEVAAGSPGDCPICGTKLVPRVVGDASEGKYEVQIDGQGRIVTLARAPSEVATPPDPEQPLPEGAREAEKEKATPPADRDLRRRLAAVFGAGLREKDLEAGRTYAIDAGPSGTAGTDVLKPMDRPFRLRFDGVATDGAFSVVRFTAVDAASDGGGVSGDVSYRMDDGLLQNLTLSRGGKKPAGEGAGGNPSTSGWLTITRIPPADAGKR